MRNKNLRIVIVNVFMVWCIATSSRVFSTAAVCVICVCMCVLARYLYNRGLTSPNTLNDRGQFVQSEDNTRCSLIGPQINTSYSTLKTYKPCPHFVKTVCACVYIW